jgi:poly(3-hydroxybutyrate) depolymerase
MPSSNASYPAVKFYRLAVVVGTVAICVTLLAYGLWPRQIAAQILPDQSIAVDESVRRFRFVIPHSLPANKVPIVFAFHGIGDSPERMAEYSAFDRLAADNGFILVYPAARRAMWATVNVDADNLDDNPDIRFFDCLLEYLAGRFRIDPSRVSLVGMSNGATFAQLLAFARPNVTAVVAHSGPMPRDLQPAANRFPVLLLVGTNDSAADAMRSDAAEYRQNGHLVEFVAIPGLGHEWSASHNDEIWRFLSRFDQR